MPSVRRDLQTFRKYATSSFRSLKLKRAFTYDWRLWTFGAIRDALKDAGFRSTAVYWEGTSKDGEGTGVYRRQKRAENTAGWNVYIVALPKARRP